MEGRGENCSAVESTPRLPILLVNAARAGSAPAMSSRRLPDRSGIETWRSPALRRFGDTADPAAFAEPPATTWKTLRTGCSR
jgi:hypothetical protein